VIPSKRKDSLPRGLPRAFGPREALAGRHPRRKATAGGRQRLTQLQEGPPDRR
jgi:hypothetical protein